jgi:hypothetical protein
MKVLATIVLLVALLGYVFKDSQVLAHWHPAYIERGVTAVGLSWFGHDHTRHVHPVAGNAFADGAPVTSCWSYDFLEKDCDGPDHYKAFADGSMIGAYRGDPWGASPPRAKACATTVDDRKVCISDYSNDGKTVWRDAGSRIVEHALTVGCPGPRLELPCKSED